MNCLLAIMAVAGVWGGPLRPLLCPPPREVHWGTGEVRLGPRILLVVGERAAPPEQYAAEQLAADLERRFGVRPEVWRKADRLPADTDAIVLGRPVANAAAAALCRAAQVTVTAQAPGPEGYVIRTLQLPEGARILIAAADASGTLYGAFTAMQLFSGAKGAPVWPEVSIDDAPVMRTRAQTGIVRKLTPEARERLDWWARWRLNAGYYEIYSDQREVPAEVKEIARECERRGIFLWGCLSNWRTNDRLGRPLCPSNSDDIKLLRDQAQQLVDHGCRGLIFLFDDIPAVATRHAESCAECKRRFGDLAGMQVGLMQPVLEVARRNKIERVMMCPTAYYAGWQTRNAGGFSGVEYYRKLAAAPELQDVLMYHCQFRAERIKEVEAAGLRHYVWWNNGVYSLQRQSRNRGLKGVWGGFPELQWGWYMAGWKTGEGPQWTEEVDRELRSLPDRTREAWLCSSGDSVLATWGTWCWDPARWDRKGARRGIARALLGEGAEAPYQQWEDSVRPLAIRLGEGLSAERWRQAAGREELLAQLEEQLRPAEQALARLRSLEERCLGTPQAPFATPAMTARVLNRMAGDVTALKQKLAEGREDRPRVQIDRIRERRVEGRRSYEQRFYLRRFWTEYALRYCVDETPEGKFQRTKWHFGSGVGMLGPSHRNWYDAGFVDVQINGRSLDGWRARVRAVGPKGREEAAQVTWDTDAAKVALTLMPLPSDGLLVDVALEPRAEINSIVAQLFAIPGAGSNEISDQDKWLATAQRTVQHTANVKLDLATEKWVLLYDRKYDVPFDGAEGPCAFLVPDKAQSAAVNLTSYVVTAAISFAPDTRHFRLGLWDLHGARNAQGLEYFKANAAKLAAEVRNQELPTSSD